MEVAWSQHHKIVGRLSKHGIYKNSNFIVIMDKVLNGKLVQVGVWAKSDPLLGVSRLHFLLVNQMGNEDWPFESPVLLIRVKNPTAIRGN